MSDQKRPHELASNIEHYLATLAKLYEREGHRQKLEVLVNSLVRVHEEWSYDNWNGGTFGHAIFLTVPEALYLSVVRKKDEIRKEIASDINEINNVQNESIDEVFIEMEALADRDWRKESGLLTSQIRTVSEDATRRIWGDGGHRVFLSHKSEVRS